MAIKFNEKEISVWQKFVLFLNNVTEELASLDFTQYELEDKSLVIIDSEGNATSEGKVIPQGNYTLIDGKILVIDESSKLAKILDELPAEPEPIESEIALAEEEPKEETQIPEGAKQEPAPAVTLPEDLKPEESAAQEFVDSADLTVEEIKEANINTGEDKYDVKIGEDIYKVEKQVLDYIKMLEDNQVKIEKEKIDLALVTPSVTQIITPVSDQKVDLTSIVGRLSSLQRK